jgi:hypothetical protein
MDNRSLTLVWIDARTATVVRRDGVDIRASRLHSDVPAHRRSTGHVRHDPGLRHGGGGSPQDAGEPRRLEHLARFLATVADRIGPDDDLVVLGPGTTREHLARRVSEGDARRHAARRITSEPAAPMTDHQLVAALRTLAGEEPKRGLRWGLATPDADRRSRARGRRQSRVAAMLTEAE